MKHDVCTIIIIIIIIIIIYCKIHQIKSREIWFVIEHPNKGLDIIPRDLNFLSTPMTFWQCD